MKQQSRAEKMYWTEDQVQTFIKCERANKQSRSSEKRWQRRLTMKFFFSVGLLFLLGAFVWSPRADSRRVAPFPLSTSQFSALSKAKKQQHADKIFKKIRENRIHVIRRYRQSRRTFRARILCLRKEYFRSLRAYRSATSTLKKLKKAIRLAQSAKSKVHYQKLVSLYKISRSSEKATKRCPTVPVDSNRVAPKKMMMKVLRKPKPAVRRRVAPSPAPAAELVRPVRLMKRTKRMKKQNVGSVRRSYRRRTVIQFDSDSVSGALDAPGGGGRGSRSGQFLLNTAKSKKDKKKGKKKPKAQVWQRSKQNTVLSKVSVGGGKFLTLKKMRINVQAEGLRVRTVIDHIYYNPHNRTLQGTFKYTLPPDASVSYYAMFVGQRQRRPDFFSGKAPTARRLNGMQPRKVARHAPHKAWGKLREARLVAAEQGRQVYEEITRRKIDPALLEQDAPNTFTGRVFPVPAKGYNRVIIAYEQTLPQLQSQHVYRFRFPPNVADIIDFSMTYNPKLSTLARSNLKAIRCKTKKSNSFVRCFWEKNKPKKDAVFYFQPKNKDISWLSGRDPVDNQPYLLSQIRVNLPKVAGGYTAEEALFLLDTSLSENPDVFGAHVSLLKKILEKNSKIKRFNVLFFDVGATWANNKGWISNTSSARKKLYKRINKIVLEGATSFSTALRTLAKPSWLKKQSAPKGRADIFMLSDGQLNWGNTQIDQLLARFHKTKVWKNTRFFAYQTGIGSENLNLFRRLVRQGGALFPCLGRSELKRCATAHTKPAMFLEKVEVKGVQAKQILVAGRQASIFPGGLLTVAAQHAKEGKAQIVLHGRFLNKKIQKTYNINLKAHGDLGPRAWGEMAVAQLAELEDPKLHKLIVAYSQHFMIPNKFCSFLILETDKEYKQYGLNKEKKAQRVQDVAKFILAKLLQKGAPVSDKQRWIALLRKSMKRFKMLRKSSGRTVNKLINTLPKKDFTFPETGETRLWLKGQVPTKYLKIRTKRKDHFDPFVNEAKRRFRKSVDGAVRALSTIVELHPSNPQALRLVGYYLSAWRRPDLAARVFLKVLERRSFEPHAFRDVARTLRQMKRFGLASALYEIMLAGQWHSRFRGFSTLAREEYALLIFDALRYKKLPGHVKRTLQQRRAMLGLKVPRSKLRVTITWNTDNTDVDLWVTGPSGSKCYYSRRSTSDGGRLLSDVTRGYGPERYENRKGQKGKYLVQMQFYGHRSNVLGNETHITASVILYAGTPQQEVIHKNFVLKRKKQIVTIARLKL